MARDTPLTQSPAARPAASLRETAELYRRWSGCLSGQQARRDVPAEHRALMQVAPNRDADRAVALLTEYINTTALMLERYAGAHSPAHGHIAPVGASDAPA